MGTVVYIEGRERRSANGSNAKRLKIKRRASMGESHYFPYEGGGRELDDTMDAHQRQVLMEVVS